MTGLAYPMKVFDIPKFERQNHISVNVFGYKKGEVIPIHITPERVDTHVNLLMIDDGKTQHYCWVKDLNRLLFDQHRKNNRRYFCLYCLHGFTKEALLEDHIPYCQIRGPQKNELPTEQDKWIFYTDVSKQLKAHYVIYADFERYATKIDTCAPGTLHPNHSLIMYHLGLLTKLLG